MFFKHVLHSIMVEDGELLQESIGLITQIFKFITREEHDKELKKTCTSTTNFAKKLLKILEKYNAPCVKVPEDKEICCRAGNLVDEIT